MGEMADYFLSTEDYWGSWDKAEAAACGNDPRRSFPFLDDENPVPLNHDKWVNKTYEQKCPKCGAKLVLKTGKYGKFFGCSKFPKCKGSLSK
jgi:hypothetical protein